MTQLSDKDHKAQMAAMPKPPPANRSSITE